MSNKARPQLNGHSLVQPANGPLPGQPRVKSKIIKEYQHDINLTYENLLNQPDQEVDSDPDETQRLLARMMPSSSQTHSHATHTLYAKCSIGGYSTVDSGVISHDSLLDRSHNCGSQLSLAASSPTSPGLHRPTRTGEFDPVLRACILDTRLKGKSHLLQQVRGRSPCRSHGVKQMISFFEGSGDGLQESQVTAESTTCQPPPTNSIACGPSASHSGALSPRRLNPDTKAIEDSQTTNGSKVTNGTSCRDATTSKQQNVIHLSCVASGYSKYSPFSKRRQLASNSLHEQTNGDHMSANSRATETGAATPGAHDSLELQNGHGLPSHGLSNVYDGGERTHGIGNTTPPGVPAETFHNDHRSPPAHGHIEPTSLDNEGAALDTNDIQINISTDSFESKALEVSIQPVIETVCKCDETKGPSDRSQAVTPKNRSHEWTDRLQDSVPELDYEDRARQLSVSLLDSPSKKDGRWFLSITDNAEQRLNKCCEEVQADLDTASLADDICGQLRAAVGKSQLLTTKKFKQFRGLCHKNLTQDSCEPFPTTSQDLAGFWDMVSIQVEDCLANFENINALRQNSWAPPADPVEVVDGRVSKPKVVRTTSSANQAAPDGTVKPKPQVVHAAAKAQSSSSAAAKARGDARKRLMAAKKAMRERQTSQSEQTNEESVMFIES